MPTISLRRAALYLPLALLPVFLMRLSLHGLPFNLLDLLMLAAVLCWAGPTAKLVRKGGPLVWAGTLLMVAGVIGVAVAGDRSTALGALKSWIVLPVLYSWTVAAAGMPFSGLVRALLPQLAAASAWGFWLLPHTGRLQAWYDSPNFFAMMAAPVLLLGLADLHASWKKLLPLHRFAYAGVLALGLAATLCTASIGGLVGLAFGIGGYWLCVSGRQRLLGGLALAALALGILIPLLLPTNTSLQNNCQRCESAKARTQIWAVARISIAEHPLAGSGLRQFPTVYDATIPQITQLPVVSSPPEPHNLFLAIWVNLGALGLAALAGIGYLAFRRLPSLLSAPAAGISAALLAMLGHGIEDTTYFHNDLSLLFWVLVALAVTLPAATKGQSAKG